MEKDKIKTSFIKIWKKCNDDQIAKKLKKIIATTTKIYINCIIIFYQFQNKKYACLRPYN